MTTNPTTIANTVCKEIPIKFPVRFIWIYTAFVILGSRAYIKWGTNRFSDTMSWIVFVISMCMIVYIFYLFHKFFNSKSLKKIVINTDDDIVLGYSMIQDWRMSAQTPYDRRTKKQDITIAVKGNKMKLLEQGKPIAKVYRDTLKDKSDWEWLIDYFGK